MVPRKHITVPEHFSHTPAATRGHPTMQRCLRERAVSGWHSRAAPPRGAMLTRGVRRAGPCLYAVSEVVGVVIIRSVHSEVFCEGDIILVAFHRCSGTEVVPNVDCRRESNPQVARRGVAATNNIAEPSFQPVR